MTLKGVVAGWGSPRHSSSTVMGRRWRGEADTTVRQSDVGLVPNSEVANIESGQDDNRSPNKENVGPVYLGCSLRHASLPKAAQVELHRRLYERQVVLDRSSN